MQKSPFDTVHQQLGANFGSHDGWTLPTDFGNIEEESKALAQSCAVVDLSSFGRIQLSGNSARETINRIFDIENVKFPQERWIWAKGSGQNEHIIARVIRLNGTFTLLAKPTETSTVLDLLTTAADSATVITNISDKTAMLGLYGPAAFGSMKGVLPLDIDYLDKGDAAKASFMMLSFTLLRGSWLNGDGLELICPVSIAPLAAGAVAKYRHKHNITPAGMDSLKRAMQQTPAPV